MNQCDNCLKIHGAIDVCLIGALAIVLEDRGHKITPEMISEVNVDGVWNELLGPAVDGLADRMDLPHYPEEE